MKIVSLIVLSICVVSTCWKIKTQNFNKYPVFNDIVVRILKECFPDTENIIVSDPAGIFIESVNNLRPIVTILFHLPFDILYDFHYVIHNKIDTYISIVDTFGQFNTTYLSFSKNIIYSADITAELSIILYTMENGCVDAKNMLLLMDEIQAINTIFFCYNSLNELMIYTYNRYLNYAPDDWNRVEIYDNQWTLYNRPYRKENLCRGLSFDRTKKLDGFTLQTRLRIKEETKSFFDKHENSMITNKNYTDFVKKYDANLISAVVNSLNVSFVYNESFNRNYGLFYIFYCDLYFFEEHVFDIYRFDCSLSVFTSYDSVHIVTHNRGVLSPIEKIYNFYGVTTVVSMIIILSITYAVIFLWEGKKLSFASFEILRLLVNVALKSQMERLSKRIFFSVIFLYFLIIQATFQGHLAGFLTKIENHKSIETLEELEDSPYTVIYADELSDLYIDGPIRDKKRIIGNDFVCEDVIKNNESVVCIDDLKKNLNAITLFNLSYSKQPILSRYGFLQYRKNFPLASRVDNILLRLTEAGLLQKWSEEAVAQNIFKMKVLAARSLVHYRPIVIEDLKFIFVTLIVGCTWAIICFAAEMLIKILDRIKQKRPINYHPSMKLMMAIRLVAIQYRRITNRLHK